MVWMVGVFGGWFGAVVWMEGWGIEWVRRGRNVMDDCDWCVEDG